MQLVKTAKAALTSFVLLSLMLLKPVDVMAMDAQQVVEDAANRVIAVLDKDADVIVGDSDKVYELVEEYILPHFDFDRMSYYILGGFWKKATDEQKQRFQSEFKYLLINTYTTALTEYDSGEKVIYHPIKTSSNPDIVIVPTEIHQKGGSPLAVAYRMFRSNDVWRIYDVVIGGISLVTNYRASFAGQIRKGGMEGLLESMVRHNRPEPEAMVESKETAAATQ